MIENALKEIENFIKTVEKHENQINMLWNLLTIIIAISVILFVIILIVAAKNSDRKYEIQELKEEIEKNKNELHRKLVEQEIAIKYLEKKSN